MGVQTNPLEIVRLIITSIGTGIIFLSFRKALKDQLILSAQSNSRIAIVTTGTVFSTLTLLMCQCLLLWISINAIVTPDPITPTIAGVTSMLFTTIVSMLLTFFDYIQKNVNSVVIEFSKIYLDQQNELKLVQEADRKVGESVRSRESIS